MLAERVNYDVRLFAALVARSFPVHLPVGFVARGGGYCAWIPVEILQGEE